MTSFFYNTTWFIVIWEHFTSATKFMFKLKWKFIRVDTCFTNEHSLTLILLISILSMYLFPYIRVVSDIYDLKSNKELLMLFHSTEQIKANLYSLMNDHTFH